MVSTAKTNEELKDDIRELAGVFTGDVQLFDEENRIINDDYPVYGFAVTYFIPDVAAGRRRVAAFPS